MNSTASFSAATLNELLELSSRTCKGHRVGYKQSVRLYSAGVNSTASFSAATLNELLELSSRTCKGHRVGYKQNASHG